MEYKRVYVRLNMGDEFMEFKLADKFTLYVSKREIINILMNQQWVETVEGLLINLDMSHSMFIQTENEQ